MRQTYFRMSERGANFLEGWMVSHLPELVTDDPGAITDLADQAMIAADREGITSKEISDEVGSVFEVILEAMQSRDGRYEGGDQDPLQRIHRESRSVIEGKLSAKTASLREPRLQRQPTAGPVVKKPKQSASSGKRSGKVSNIKIPRLET